MAYTKQTWADLPSKTTPISANRLNHIEDGIYDAAAVADNAAGAIGNLGSAAYKDSTNAVEAASTDLVESGAVYYEINEVKQDLNDTDLAVGALQTSVTNLGKYKAEADSIAPVELDATGASQAYAVDEQFYLLDVLLTATSPIAQNDAIVVYPTAGYNCKPSDSVTGQIKTNSDDIKNIYDNIGLLTTPVSAEVANNLPPRFKNITSDFYLGTLRSEIAAGNFANVRVGDYIIGQTTGSKYYVAECDGWLGKGDTEMTTHHIRIILEKAAGITQLWKGVRWQGDTGHYSASELNRCPWNAATDVDPTSSSAQGSNSTNITRNGASGYLGSFIRDRLINRLLPDCFQADFGSANVLKCRNLLGNAINTEKASAGMPTNVGITSGWGWADSYLDLPSEVELYGTVIFSSSAMDVGAQDQQLALFKQVKIEKIFPRMDVWTKAVASSSTACFRYGGGVADDRGASFDLWACPLAAVK